MHRLNSWTKLVSAGALSVAVAMPAVAAPSTMGDDQSIYQGVVPAATGRVFSITAKMRTLYDSNMLRRGDGFGVRPGESISDVRFSPAVLGEVGLPFGRQRLYATGTIGRDYYANNSQLNRNRYEIAGGAALAAGTRCTANLDGSFTQRQILLSEIGDLVPNSQKTGTYGASANCASAVGLGFGANVRRTTVRNDNPTRAVFNLNGTSYGANLNYRLGLIGQFSASANKNHVTYLNRQQTLPDGSNVDDGVDITSGRLGFQRDLGTRLALTLGLSYFESKPNPTTVLQLVGVTPTNPPIPVFSSVDRSKFTGLGYDAQIAYQPSTRLAIVLAANRNASASVNVGALSQVRTSYLLDVDYKLGSNMSVGTGGSYDRRKYQDSIIGGPDLGRQRIEDKVSRVYANIGYTSPRLLSASFEVAYQNRKSVPVDFSFNSFSASLNLSARFGRTS